MNDKEIVSRAMKILGSEGGKVSGNNRTKEQMSALAKLSWTPAARANRLSKQRAKHNESPKLNNNKSIAQRLGLLSDDSC